MTGTHTVLETPADAIHRVLPDSPPIEAWHQAITTELLQRLGPVHAGLFAQPVPGAAGPTWVTSGRQVRRYVDLPAEDRRSLTAAIGSLLSDIRRLSESGLAPSVTASWPALRDVPDYPYVFAVDGRPVLAGWGHRATPGRAGLFAHADDGLPWRAPPLAPWRSYAAAFVALALFALAAGLVLPLFARWIVPGPTACSVSPDQLALLREQGRMRQHGDELHALLADLQTQEGQQHLRCPLPQAPPTPAAATPAALPPPAAAALPQDRWEKHDLTMLEGCWHKYTNLVTTELVTGRHFAVHDWQLCFDQPGRGHQTIIWTDGKRCEGDLRASFAADGTLNLRDIAHCHGSRDMLPEELTCRRVSDREAECDMRDIGGPNAGQGEAVPSKFRR